VVGHVACIEDIRNAYRIAMGNLKDRDLLEDLSIDERLECNNNFNLVSTHKLNYKDF
jgi:hypothetical protein